jgi:hypothetical protein
MSPLYKKYDTTIHNRDLNITCSLYIYTYMTNRIHIFLYYIYSIPELGPARSSSSWLVVRAEAKNDLDMSNPTMIKHVFNTGASREGYFRSGT